MRPIAISLSPNTEKEDVLLSLKSLFSPWTFFKGNCIKNLEQWFRNYFKTSYAVSFNSGRASLYAILKALEIEKGDEIIIQTFTCVAIPNSIISLGAVPVYLDIDFRLTIDSTDLKKKISKKTKAIIFQYTFGIPGSIEEVIRIAKEKKIKVIEDCAHVIGGVHNSKKLGTFGDVGFFSFGRDKAFSSVFGGMAVTNNEELGKKIRLIQKQKEYPSIFWIYQQVFHSVAFAVILPLYNLFFLGKIILVILQKLRLLSFPVSDDEKKIKYQGSEVKKLPNILACLALSQLRRVEKFNKKRKEISKIYFSKIQNSKLNLPQDYPLLRFPILVGDRDKVLSKFKKKGIYLGDWYSNVIDPKETDSKKSMYKKGSCPNAEKIAEKMLNLPTYPVMKIKDAERVVQLLKQYEG